jgi:hypothetical protein
MTENTTETVATPTIVPEGIVDLLAGEETEATGGCCGGACCSGS